MALKRIVSDRRALTKRQKHHASGLPPVTQRLADLIDEVCSDSPTVTQLIARLQHQGVKVYPSFSTKGLFKEAIAFELDGVKVAGNKLGSAYSFPGLQKKRGMSYDPKRDMPAIIAAAGRNVEPHELAIGQNLQSPPSEQAVALVRRQYLIKLQEQKKFKKCSPKRDQGLEL